MRDKKFGVRSRIERRHKVYEVGAGDTAIPTQRAASLRKTAETRLMRHG